VLDRGDAIGPGDRSRVTHGNSKERQHNKNQNGLHNFQESFNPRLDQYGLVVDRGQFARSVLDVPLQNLSLIAGRRVGAASKNQKD